MKKNVLRNTGIVFAFIFMFAACTNAVSSPSGESDGKNKTVKPEPSPVANSFREVPLTLEALGDNTTITLGLSYHTIKLKYKIDDGEIIEVTTSKDPIEISISKKSCISFYAEGTDNSPSGYFYIRCSADCYVYGNVMSLLSSDFKDNTEITQPYAFCRLFSGCGKKIKNSPQKKLLLPATSLAEGCYRDMFHGCASLTEAPALPATKLAEGCYQGMFSGCASLEKAPELPAKSLAEACYAEMFRGCKSLKTTPALPATSLEKSCYSNMFYECTSLTAAPALPATSLADWCYSYMFSGCTSLTEAPALPATSLADCCYYCMFRCCTSLETAPALPATKLTDSCYEGMFCACSSLETAPILPAEKLIDECYFDMFLNCHSLKYVQCLATDVSAKKCLERWIEGVATTGTFVKSPSASWAVAGKNSIPSGWTVTDAD